MRDAVRRYLTLWAEPITVETRKTLDAMLPAMTQADVNEMLDVIRSVAHLEGDREAMAAAVRAQLEAEPTS